jgi:hypothetical protein
MNECYSIKRTPVLLSMASCHETSFLLDLQHDTVTRSVATLVENEVLEKIVQWNIYNVFVSKRYSIGSTCY